MPKLRRDLLSFVLVARTKPACQFASTTQRKTAWAEGTSELWSKEFQNLTYEQKIAFSYDVLDACGGFAVRETGTLLYPAY